nr:MAG TPA: hypothetical protein [Caudoviricetes sp.]
MIILYLLSLGLCYFLFYVCCFWGSRIISRIFIISYDCCM